MNNSIAAKLTQICVRLEELTHLLSSETATANLDNYRKLTRERAELDDRPTQILILNMPLDR